MTDAYDAVPYTEHAYAESHPDNLLVVGCLSGWSPKASPARVLELGCGRGGNLLPMASSWPDATFVGVDRSAVQIREAKRIADAAGLTNVRLEADDLGCVELPPASFDFILCHGVYSWISAPERRAMLARIQAWLAPTGVAYVSFNTLPGWYRKLAARDWMRFAARWSEEKGRDPRQELAWLLAVASPEHDAYRKDLEAVRARLLETDPAYVTHEYLAEEHHPVHVTTFLAEASDAGLSYLGDAIPSETALELTPDAVRARAKSLDVPQREALVDFTRDTAFRRALLVRADTATTSGFRSPAALSAAGLLSLRVASRLLPCGDGDAHGLESFGGARGTVQASGALAAALRALADVAPRSIPYPELFERSGRSAALATELADLWLAGIGVDLHAREPILTAAVSSHPVACPVARWHAVHGGPITNRWHQEVVLPEQVVRDVLGSLDGGRSTADPVVTASLVLLARSALLIR
jgi:SAM-dependent methyltransferase